MSTFSQGGASSNKNGNTNTNTNTNTRTSLKPPSSNVKSKPTQRRTTTTAAAKDHHTSGQFFHSQINYIIIKHIRTFSLLLYVEINYFHFCFNSVIIIVCLSFQLLEMKC